MADLPPPCLHCLQSPRAALGRRRTLHEWLPWASPAFPTPVCSLKPAALQTRAGAPRTQTDTKKQPRALPSPRAHSPMSNAALCLSWPPALTKMPKHSFPICRSPGPLCPEQNLTSVGLPGLPSAEGALGCIWPLWGNDQAH